MPDIVIGTTPTIKYTFHSVEPSDIVSAFLTFKQSGRVLLIKSLTDAEVGGDYISWRLSQEDTLTLGIGDVEIVLNWLTNSDIRGVGNKVRCKCVQNHISEVISND